MRRIRRAVKLALGVAAGLTLTLSGTPAAIAATSARPAKAASTWTLLDVDQRICVTSSFGHPGAYFVVPIVGTWSRTINIGIRNLPPGSSSPGGTPLPPGSNNGSPQSGVTIQRFIGVSIGPAPVGVYTPEIWASDGIQTQAVPVTIVSKERC